MLVKYLLFTEPTYFGFTIAYLRRLAHQLATKNNFHDSFKTKEAGTGTNLVLQSHKTVHSLRKPTGSMGFNKVNVRKCLTFWCTMSTNILPIAYILLMKQALLSSRARYPPLSAGKERVKIEVLTFAERGSTMTVIVCMNAKGELIHLVFIFPRNNMSELLMKGKPAGSSGRAHPLGWVQSNLFVEWMQHFVEKAHPTADSPGLLILDGHCSHMRTFEVIEIIRENNSKIISLPPHFPTYSNL